MPDGAEWAIVLLSVKIGGVAMLGALYDACSDGAVGLRVAMLAGSAVQLAGAALAWHTAGTRVPAGARRPIG